VWRHSGSVAFSNPRQKGESGWGKLAAVRDEGNGVSIEATSLDDWYQNLGSPEIRAIKIDAEGSEPFILEGAGRLIAKARPFLIVELNEQLLREGGGSKKDIIATLKEKRYRLFAIRSEQLEELSECGASCSEVLCLPCEKVEEAKKPLGPLE